MEGNTANYVETESIISYKNNELMMSHITVRGSAPVLWEQKGIKGTIRLTGGYDMSYEAFNKHH